MLRDALESSNKARNTSLKLAQGMLSSLKAHRLNGAWNLADHCLSNCTDITDRVEAGQTSESLRDPIPEYLIDNSAFLFDDSFLGFDRNFDFDLDNFSSPSAWG